LEKGKGDDHTPEVIQLCVQLTTSLLSRRFHENSQRMHIPEHDSFAAALKKRKRELAAGGSGSLWNQENLTTEQ
jgi:hypothetical protein